MKKIIKYAFLLLSVLAIGQNAGDIIVTEIQIDPSGSEFDREWFEVYNTTSSAIDMMGWVIVDQSSSGDSHVIQSSVVIQPNSYAVFTSNGTAADNGGISNSVYSYGFDSPVGGPVNMMTSADTPRFNNESTYAGGSTNDDGVGLELADGTVIDEVVYGYGYNGLNNFPDMGATEGVSYQLNANSLDSASNDVGENWRASTASYGSNGFLGTPGTANFGFSSGVLSPGDIVITELMFDPKSSNEQDREWFEVYNTTSADIDLNGWMIVDNSSSGRNHTINSMSPVIVPANSYAVLVYNDDTAVNAGITNAIYSYGAGTGNSNSGFPTWNNESTYINGSTTADGPGLISATGILIDEIEYGFGYNGLNAWPAQGAEEAVSYQLDADFIDSTSNDDATNWIASTNLYGSFNNNDYFGTPGTANFAVSSLVAVGDILITELMIDPSSSNEADAEYFEVYNTTSSPINLRGWTIVDVSSSGRNHEITTSAIVPANSYAILAGSSVSADNGGIPSVLYAYGFNSPPGGTSGAGTDFPRFNNESSFSSGDTDGVALISPGAVEVDRVEYDYSLSGIGFPEVGASQGASYELGFSYFNTTQNDLGEAWAAGISAFGDGDLGTPGAANDYNRVYTHDGAWLAPFNDPSGTSNPTADVVVDSGNAMLTNNVSSRNITINGGDLTLDSGVVLSVNGDIVANGSLQAMVGELIFNGSTRQNISGGNVSDFGNVTIDNAAGLGNSAIINLMGELELISGDLDNAGIITFRSTATATGTLMELPTGSSLTGDYKVERFIPVAGGSSGRVFRFLASSVNTSSSIFANWQEAGADVANQGTHITGVVGTPGTVNMATGLDETSQGSPSAFKFSNGTDQQWNPLTSTNQVGDELAALDAYRVFIRGDRSAGRLAGVIQANATTLTATGQIAQGDQDRTYDVDGGDFLMIGNPYQSAVDMETVLARSTNINNNVIYYWDPNLGGANGQGAYTTVFDFASGGTATTNPASNNTEFMQPGQSAFFQVTAGADGVGNDAVVSFRESDKGTSTDLSSGTVFGINNGNAQRIGLNLYDTASYTQGATMSDAIIVRFDPSYSDQIDGNDFVKFTNPDETLAVIDPVGDYGVYSLSQVTDGLVIPLRLTNYGDLDYTFEMTIGSFPGYDVFLNDNFTNTRTLIDNTIAQIVNFSVDPSVSGSIDGMRFTIEFETSTLGTVDVDATLFSIYPNPAVNGAITIQSQEDHLDISIYNSLGQQVLSKNVTVANRKVSTETLKSGIYFVKATSNERTSTIKLIIK